MVLISGGLLISSILGARWDAGVPMLAAGLFDDEIETVVRGL